MKYKTIAYQRVKNLGNYESERLELTAEVDEDEDEDISSAIELLKETVHKGLGIVEKKEVTDEKKELTDDELIAQIPF